MTRLIGPDQSERVFFVTSGAKKGTIVPAGTPIPLYADSQASQPADVRALDGSVIAGDIPTVLVGDTLEVPQFQFPDVPDPVVYTRVLGGPVVALHPRTDDRVDSLTSRLTAVEAGGSGDALLLHKAGSETVTGAKTFSTSPTVPTPSSNGHAATKAYVDALGATAATKAYVDAGTAAAAATYAPARDALPTLDTSATTVPSNDRVLFMDSQGRLLRGGTGSTLQRSTDDGSTWSTIYTFPRAVTGIRQLDNGELLVGIADDYPTNTVKASVWVSSNYASGTLTFTQKITADDYQQALDLTWGFGGANGIYVVSEYDSKAPGSRTGTQRMWLTQDSFATVTPIYDHGNGSLASRHIHGCTYDPYRGAIWMTLGDYTGNANGARAIMVSWDLGQNWTTVSTDFQPTAIYAFPGCVVFGQDNPPNGVLRIVNPSATNLKLEVAYKLNNYVDSVTNRPAISHVAETPFRATWPGAPLLLPFSSSVAGTMRGHVLSTPDGFHFQELWRSSANYTASGLGPNRAVGPTPSGKVFISGRGEGSTWFQTAVTQSLPGLTSAAATVGQTWTRALPKRAYIAVANQSSPSFQSVPGGSTWNEMLLSTTAVFFEDDPAGLFSVSPDGLGIIVARDTLVRIEVDTGMNGAFSSPQVAIAINSSRKVFTRGAYLARTMWVRSGERVSAYGLHAGGSPVTVDGTSYGMVLDAVETW